MGRSQHQSKRERKAFGLVNPVNPGDHIVAKCWMKTENSTPEENTDPYHGARIGLDLYVIYADGSGGIVDSYPHDGAEHLASMVMWNTPNWTQKTWDIIIPHTVYTTYANGQNLPSPSKVTHIVMWMQAVDDSLFNSSLIGSRPARAWFADAELYINP